MADDDDLLSLDFTLPGALATPPAEPPAPPVSTAHAPTLELLPLDAPPTESAQPESAQPEPAQPERARTESVPPAATPANPPSLPAALAEAAALHAAGQSLDAVRRLEAALKNGEDCADREAGIWGGLFDLLQELGRRAAFDTLALAFARRFEKSPPTWSAVPGTPDDDGDGATAHAVHASSGGRAHVALSGRLDAGVGEVLKQALKLAHTSSLVRIDLGKLDDADNDGATLLLRALAALKKAGKDYVLGRPEQLTQCLAARLRVGERRDEALWLLLLELYQRAFRQDAFEETAVNYAVTFEVSPPSWEAPPPAPTPAPAVPAAATSADAARTEGLALRGQLVGAEADEFAALEAAARAKSGNEIEIDAHQLARIDAGSTRALLACLGRLQAAGKRLRIVGLPVLVAAWLEAQGAHAFAELRSRAL